MFLKRKNPKLEMTYEDINNMLINVFKQEPLKSLFFNFDIEKIKSCVFEIECFDVVLTKDNKFESLNIVLKEITYGENITMTLPLETLRLFFKDFQLKKPDKKKEK